jgi:hypothetical protein
MADVITLLERMGCDVRMRTGGLDQVLSEAGVDEETRTALRGPERRRLEELLGARMDLFCGQHPAKEDEDDEESDVPPDEDEEEEEPKPERLKSRGAALA